MKYIYHVILLLSSGTSVFSDSKQLCQIDSDHEITDGCLAEGYKLYQKTISAAAIWFKVRTVEFSFPEKGTVEVINCVKVKDLVPNNRGGCPFIKSGGNGFNFVDLEFVSQRSRKMEFTIEIYGKR